MHNHVRAMLAVLVALSLAACGGTAMSTVTPARVDAPTMTPPATIAPGRTPDSVTPLASATVARPAPDISSVTATPGVTRAAVVATPTPIAVPNTAPVATATRPAPSAQATAAPATVARSAAHVTSIPSSPPKQSVGTQTDGLALLNVRAGSHDGYTRLVFDFAKTDGSASAVPRAQVWSQQGAVVVMISGVRQDTFGQALGRGEQAVNSGAVIALYRIPTFDDAAVAYGISTKGAQGVTVTTSIGPARLIVDIAD